MSTIPQHIVVSSHARNVAGVPEPDLGSAHPRLLQWPPTLSYWRIEVNPLLAILVTGAVAFAAHVLVVLALRSK